jgi:RecQ family ATP-dependent DNA helicase
MRQWMKRSENSKVVHVAAFFFRSMKSLSWDDEAPAARIGDRHVSVGMTGRPSCTRLDRRSSGPKIRKRVDSMAFEPSVLEVKQPENVSPENESVKKAMESPMKPHDVIRYEVRPQKVQKEAVSRITPEAVTDSPRPDIVPHHANKSAIPEIIERSVSAPDPARAPVVATKKRKIAAVLKDEKSSGGSSVGTNFVYQDLKMKNGTKSSKGAEKLRRKIKRARNERWREANGIKARGKRAVNHRREQLAKELRHEKTIAEITSLGRDEMFSSAVDTTGLFEETDIVPEPSIIPKITCDRTELEEFLKDEFGYAEFRSGQYDAIQAVLSQQERNLIILPTGRGKSLCYQFPSVFLRKKFGITNQLTIVVSPLIALINDQLKQLPPCCRGAVIHSNLSPTQVSLVYAAIAKGRIDILFVAPERLLMFSVTDLLSKNSSVLLVAVDEAHCLSEWSHSFRPAYLALGKIIDDQIKPKSLLALTATATQQTVASLESVLSIKNIIRTDGVLDQIGSVQRDNLDLFAKRSPNPVMDLIEFFMRPEMISLGPVIVYVQYKWQTENVANILRERGLGSAEPYHAGMSSKERSEVHNRFINNELRFVVATVAFGMGIDKSNLRAVIHLCVPKSIENYVQESGRCSRDGKEGFCRCFFNADDFIRIRNKAESEAITRLGVERVIQYVLDRSYKLLFVPEKMEMVSQGHMSLILSILERDEKICQVFQRFPQKIKLRFFGTPMSELAPIDPFVDILFHSPCENSKGADTVTERGGVATIDLPRAVARSEMLPPKFMHQLSMASKAQKFAFEKSEWGHILYVDEQLDKTLVDVEEMIDRVFEKAISNHRLEMNRLDASFALLSRIAAETITDNKIGHKIIQQYFAAEGRIPTGDDLVPSIIDGAPPGVARSIQREIDNIRNNSVN